MAHIHCGAARQIGPIVVWLVGAPLSSPLTWEVDGKWIDNAAFTDADLMSSDCGDNLAELIESIRSGGAYVNVHTRANMGGEVRGQIKPQTGRR